MGKPPVAGVSWSMAHVSSYNYEPTWIPGDISMARVIRGAESNKRLADSMWNVRGKAVLAR